MWFKDLKCNLSGYKSLSLFDANHLFHSPDRQLLVFSIIKKNEELLSQLQNKLKSENIKMGFKNVCIENEKDFFFPDLYQDLQ